MDFKKRKIKNKYYKILKVYKYNKKTSKNQIYLWVYNSWY